MRPLCFVLMPFGRKSDASGKQIDFDAVYQNLIVPAILEAGLEPIRADEEMTGGIIHKPMFERLILCEYAVADLTTANANVFYELGVRHAVRPRSTVLLFSEGGSQLPFDVAPLRAMSYRLGPDGKPVYFAKTQRMLTDRLIEAKEAITDSPLYQLVDGYPDIDHTRTDIFRDRVAYSAEMKNKLAEARNKGVDKLQQIERELGDIRNVESGIVIDLFLSYRAVQAWEKMIDLVNKMCAPLVSTIMVQEQFGFALNRSGRSKEAEQVLLKLIKNRGPSSETYGILGRVYKDRWEAAVESEKKFEARGLLEKAIEAYRKGFETDWRDAYPGINAITLMELKEPPDPERNKLIPVVTYAVERKMMSGEPDYWDHATMLELAVFAGDQQQAEHHLGNALAHVRERWEPETTARNLRLIREARQARNEMPDWAIDLERALMEKAGKESGI
jgi:tetratricopeptide (TPR) repeat protein